jgi:hypothetical protein
MQVLCTNPAALGGGSALVDTISPSKEFDPASILQIGIKALGLPQPHPPTVWVSQPRAYRARCASSNGANVLMISAVGGAKLPNPSPTPEWGLHLLDAQVALGNEVADVKTGAAAFLRRSR